MRVKSAFEEIGLPNSPELETKSRLIRCISAEIKRRRLTQAAAGNILGLDQPNVSALLNQKISRFSIQKLMEFAARLDFNVSIRVEGHGSKMNLPVIAAE